LRHLNNELQAQIIALQGTQAQMQSEDEPERWVTHDDGPVTLWQPRPTSLLYENNFDNEADSPHYQTGIQRGQTRRIIEELPDIRTLDELV